MAISNFQLEDRTSDIQGSTEPLSPWVKRLVSVALIYHLLALVVGPFTFSTALGVGAAAPLAESTMSWFSRYSHLDFAYLNHGYYFFAPDPGPSHLIEYQIIPQAGSSERPFVSRSPDLERQWPRLLYHRHFMLSEWLHNNFVPNQPPEAARSDPAFMADWRVRRQLYERTKLSFENHLRKLHNAADVDVVRIEHRPPMLYEKLERELPLNDPSLYVSLPG